MDTQVLDPHTMFIRKETTPRQRMPARWFRGLKALPAVIRETSEICARIDRELPAAEARADRLLRHYGL